MTIIKNLKKYFTSEVTVLDNESVGSEEELTEIFKVLDSDDKDLIGAVEVRHVTINLGKRLVDEEVDEMIRKANVEGEGPINHEGFVKLTMASGRGTPRMVRMPRVLPSWGWASVCPRPINSLGMVAESSATNFLEEKAEDVETILLCLLRWADGLVESRDRDEW